MYGVRCLDTALDPLDGFLLQSKERIQSGVEPPHSKKRRAAVAAISPKALLGKLNPTCQQTLFAAVGMCSSRTHYHVEIEHWLSTLFELAAGATPRLLRPSAVAVRRVRRDLAEALNRLKTGNARKPDLSFDLLDLIQEAWLHGSLEHGAPRV